MFCLGPNPTDCIILLGYIMHLSNIDAIQVFSFSFSLKSENTD